MSLSRIFTDDAAFTITSCLQIGPSCIHQQRAKGGQSEIIDQLQEAKVPRASKVYQMNSGLPLLKRFSPVTVAPSLDDIDDIGPFLRVATVIGYQIRVTGILGLL